MRLPGILAGRCGRRAFMSRARRTCGAMRRKMLTMKWSAVWQRYSRRWHGISKGSGKSKIKEMSSSYGELTSFWRERRLHRHQTSIRRQANWSDNADISWLLCNEASACVNKFEKILAIREAGVLNRIFDLAVEASLSSPARRPVAASVVAAAIRGISKGIVSRAPHRPPPASSSPPQNISKASRHHEKRRLARPYRQYNYYWHYGRCSWEASESSITLTISRGTWN